MTFPQKISLVKTIADEVIHDTDKKYRKINDLLLFTEDPKNIDVVLKAVQQLCRVFVDIIPEYRIREDASKKEEENGAKKLSKEVTQLRNYESFLLETYKRYLTILETLSKIKPGHLVQRTKLDDENERNALYTTYTKLRASSISSFCTLIKRHPHFNYRMNIL